VQEEFKQTQELVDSKNKEIETEDHMKQIEERQAGKFKNDYEKLEAVAADYQDRLNNIQNMIFKANEKIDQFKLEMNWNQEELEQWALASRQKEEDNLTLEKYRRADEAKIKELQLKIESQTIEVARRMADLEREVTETRAAQMQLDKTAEECRRVHEERHKIYEQLVEIVRKQEEKKKGLEIIGKELGNITVELKQSEDEKRSKKDALSSQEKSNKSKEADNETKSRVEDGQRKVLKKDDVDVKNLEDVVKSLKTELSARAMTLSQLRAEATMMSHKLDQQKERLLKTRSLLDNTRKQLSKHGDAKDTLESRSKDAQNNFVESNKAVKAKEKELDKLKETYIKVSQELFKLSEEKVKSIALAGQQMASKKNLEAKRKTLEEEQEKQEEKLYNLDYKIQEITRNVAQAKGEGTQEEKKRKEEVKNLEEKKAKEKEQEAIELKKEISKLEDEKKTVERNIDKYVKDKVELDNVVHNLKLETDMLAMGIQGSVKKKEGVLLSHDLMKLEIKKRAEIVSLAADESIGEENKKAQLEMSLEEREKEIHVHKEIMSAEVKAAEEERHKIAVELQNRNNKVKNLKIRYESLMGQNKSTTADTTGDGEEHSQAYYVIKAAQEKEELQRYGDELDGKINKCQKELQALKNTLEHLKKRNRNVREKFTEGVVKADIEKKEVLEEQCRAASETLFKRRKELGRLQKECEDMMKRVMQIEGQKQNIESQTENLKLQNEQLSKDLQDQQQKIDRAKKGSQTKKSNYIKAAPEYKETESASGLEMQLEDVKLKNNYMLNALR
jgi:chromosome segregation ATPase